MKRIDFNERLHETYHNGRTFPEHTACLWMETIGRHLPQRPALVALDLGCGTGRFSPWLARSLGALVTAVDPSERMLAVARERSAHPNVRYVKGCGEDIPAGDAECDFAVLSMVVHHLQDLNACCAELQRVLRPGGKVFVRNAFKGRLGSFVLYRFWPAALAADEKRLPVVGDVRDTFAANGFELEAWKVVEQEVAPNLRAYHERMARRAVSSFELISEEEFQAGLAALKVEAEREEVPGPVVEGVDLLVFRKREGTN